MTASSAAPVDAPTRPLVAVVVPTYRVEDFVTACLESVIAQDTASWECLVVDDGSPDASGERAEAVAARDPRIRVVHQPNSGVSAARNRGLSMMSPSVRYVAFLDPDDLWLPTTLGQLVTALERAPTAVGAWGWAETIDERGEPLDPGAHPARQRDRRRVRGWRLEAVPAEDPLTFDEAVVVSPLWPPAGALFRREAVDATGGFDVAVRQVDDWDFYLRLLRRGDVVSITRVLALYRTHDGQAMKRVADTVVFADAVRRKTWASPDNTPAQRRAASRAWRQLQARRTLRCAQRLVGAVRGRRWRDAARLALGLAVLAAQNAAPGPPRTSPRQVRWSGRTV